MPKKITVLLSILSFIAVHVGMAQPSTGSDSENQQIPYSDLNSWWSRSVKESRLIGGNEIIYFEPGPSSNEYQKIEGTINDLTPWASSNVRAEVGVAAANQSVYREERNGGYCARLETNLKKVVVLGIVNVKAIASGSIFLGEMEDPITDPKNPRQNTMMGIPFDNAPKALTFDYKLHIGQKRQKATGGLRVHNVDGADKAEVYMLLQNRSEDQNRNLKVTRVGTAWQRFGNSTDEWQNGYSILVKYGDASSSEGFEPYMNLISPDDPYYAYNSAGEKVAYHEEGWSDDTSSITHVILVFSASYQGSEFIGSADSRFWIDNIQLLYD